MPVTDNDTKTGEETDGLHLGTMIILLLLCGAFWLAVCSGIFHFLS